MKENDNSSSTKADTQSAEKIIFDIIVNKTGKKNERATINKEYESIKNNIGSIVQLIGNSQSCIRLCNDKYRYKSQLGRKNILKEAGNAYRNIDTRPTDMNGWGGMLYHKFKQAVNYVAPIGLTTLGVAATAFGVLGTVMTGGAIIPLSWMTAGLLGTTVGLQFTQGTTKHHGVSDANYYMQKVNEIMNDDAKDKDVDTLKEDVVALTKALVKLQSGLVMLSDTTVDKYCQKLKDLVGCIQKKEEEQKIKNNDEKDRDVNINQPNSLYNNNIKNSKNDVINNNNLTAKDKNDEQIIN
ncbi:MAG: hypothetical protein IJT15_04550 [Rickettsiales bacterium]|nr:hypothetical protein [Rickettsiales bacterium]